MNVLVTDGEQRAALAVTRSLGRNSCNVYVTGVTQKNISASSKHCCKAFQAHDPLSDGKAYSKTIIDIVKEEKIDAIFPITEQSIFCLNNIREQFESHIILACAPFEEMERVCNKYELFQTAEKLGVKCPATLFIKSNNDYFEKRLNITEFPVVIKPSFSKIQYGEKVLSTGVMYAANLNELDRFYESKPELRFPSLIQELIVGEGTGLFTLFDKENHLVLFSHRRILEKPPSGGVSVISESISLDAEMVEAAKKLLLEVKWTGIAMVEFKRDVRDGKPKLMEINGRFWGSLQLAIASGIDFPVLCLDYYSHRKPITNFPNYTVGQKLKWLFGILDHLIIRFKKRKSLQNLPPETPSSWRVALELLNIEAANTSYDTFDIKDLMPVVTESKLYLKNIFRTN